LLAGRLADGFEDIFDCVELPNVSVGNKVYNFFIGSIFHIYHSIAVEEVAPMVKSWASLPAGTAV
jgi:hypothetical protein